jgi:hypothetical protein
LVTPVINILLIKAWEGNILMDVWIGILVIVIGLGSCFYGYPLFRIFLILAGLIYGYLFGHSFVPASHPWLALAIGCGAAVILAMLAYPLWSIGIVVIGVALGFMILSSFGLALKASLGAVILLGIVGGAALGFLFYRTRDLFVMLATAFNGAVQVIYGLNLVFPPVLALWSGRANFLPVVALVVLGVFGFAAQYGMFKDQRTYSR